MREYNSKGLLPDELKQKLDIYEKAHENRDAHQISNIERVKKNLMWSTELIYGEIVFQYYIPILDYADIKEGEVFWDLGCGGGKPVFTAALAYP